MFLSPAATPTKSAAAFEKIRDAIQSGELPPGTRITLTQLAADLGMSLTPVREALRLLASQGLVVYTPHVGTVVADHSWNEAEEIYRLRLVLEPLAASRACELASGTDLDALEAAQAATDRAIQEGNVHLVPDLNKAFHTQLYALARSTYLSDFIDTLWRGLPFQTMSLTDRAVHSSSEHHEVLEALHKKDPELTAALMHAHISAAAAAARQILQGG
jgi:DNA-binding GntR family transcriptional regulator